MTSKRSAKPVALHLTPAHYRRARQWPRTTLKWTGLILGPIVLILVVVGLYYYPKAKRVLADVRQVQSLGHSISHNISQQQFAAAHTDVTALQTGLQTTQDDFHKMRGLAHWPYVGRQYTTVDQLLTVGRDGAQAVGPLVDFLEHLFAPFAGQGKISLASISPKDKGLLLAGIADREDSLRQAQTAIHKASDDFDRIPTKGLYPKLQSMIQPIHDQFPTVIQAIDQAIPATHLLPPILGYPQPKTYLFLLENNAELRPGGGFIGTYGIMKVSSGEITSLQTDNSYNIDANAKKLSVITPPLPMQIYLKQHAWYFRDANWSPDFPTSAQQALTLYQREGGIKKVDGVLAVTPTMISALLKLVGPITVGKTKFTADTFSDQLQYYVDQGFKYAGQDTSQRKDIIGVMTQDLMSKLLSLPLTQWKDLFVVMSQQLQQKQLLMYMTNSTTQSLLEQQNWAGALQPKNGADYLMVADANLASLKTDPTIYRTYNYGVKLTDQGAEATVTVHYDHRGKFDWKTTRYRTYVRIYVPAGSTLIDTHGAQIRERSNAPGQVTTSSELGMTVFGAFKSIEPGTTSDFTVHYRLPQNVADQLRQGTYALIAQKEAGVTKAQIHFTLTTPDHTITSLSGLDTDGKISHDTATLQGPLDQDQTIIATIK